MPEASCAGRRYCRTRAGLLNCDPSDPESAAEHTVPLDPDVVRTIDRSGGTILHTSRTNPAKVRASDEPDFLADGEAIFGPSDEFSIETTRPSRAVLPESGVYDFVTDSLEVSPRTQPISARASQPPETAAEEDVTPARGMPASRLTIIRCCFTEEKWSWDIQVISGRRVSTTRRWKTNCRP